MNISQVNFRIEDKVKGATTMINAVQNNLPVQSAGSVNSAKSVTQAANKTELPEAAPKNVD